jgi:F-type H+-transporting ATPase subunit alpha
MDIRAAEISKVIRDQIASFGTEAQVSEVGTVLSVGDGIARIHGLDNVQAGEMIAFPNGIQGMALNLEADNVGAVIFGNDSAIKEGDTVRRTGTDRRRSRRQGAARPRRRRPRQPDRRQGPDRDDRAPPRRVKAPGHHPAQVGARAGADRPQGIGRARPVGRGQRELIIGDRQTGKSAVALDTFINQRKANAGRRREPEALLHLRRHRPEALDRRPDRPRARREWRDGVFIVVAATASEPAPLQFLAPLHRLHDGRIFPRQRHARRHRL